MLEPSETADNSNNDVVHLPDITDKTKMFYSLMQTLRPDHASVRQIAMFFNILDDQMKTGEFAYNDIEQLELVKNNFFKFRHDSTYRGNEYASAYAVNRLGALDQTNNETLPKLTTEKTTSMLTGSPIPNDNQNVRHTISQSRVQMTNATRTTRAILHSGFMIRGHSQHGARLEYRSTGFG